jgi:hypothetical protein
VQVQHLQGPANLLGRTSSSNACFPLRFSFAGRWAVAQGPDLAVARRRALAGITGGGSAARPNVAGAGISS